MLNNALSDYQRKYRQYNQSEGSNDEERYRNFPQFESSGDCPYDEDTDEIQSTGLDEGDS